MGLLDWFRQVAQEKPVGSNAASIAPALAVADDGSAELGGLNFKTAVDAHMKWKVRLEDYINGASNEELKVEIICRDDQCPLGKWIYGRGGSEFGHTETYLDVKDHHANFHRCAGNVLQTAKSGLKEKALEMLHQGDYARASESVKRMLARLFVLVSDGKVALDSHKKWKERLSDYVAGKGSELDAQMVGRDDDCPLGHWMKGDMSKPYHDRPAFAVLQQAHIRLHASASHIVELVKLGRRDEAKALIEKGEFADASNDIVAAVAELFPKPA